MNPGSCSQAPASEAVRPRARCKMATGPLLYGHLMPGNEEEAVALIDAYLERGATDRTWSGWRRGRDRQ